VRTDLFDFHLPEDLIAQHPLEDRTASRLLHVSADAVHDRKVMDLPSLLDERDVLVFNNSKVIPARLFATRGEAHIEFLLHKELGNQRWSAFAKPAKRLRVGDAVHIAEDMYAQVQEKCATGEVVLHFNAPTRDAFFDQLVRYGHMPLPPYMKRADAEADKERYQTVYAQHEGSVAAPTAGLHFTQGLLDALKARGVGMEYVTLHVGGGTFLPVKVEDTHDHVMHSEYAVLSVEVAQRLNAARREGKRIVAVGTTSMRTLESAADDAGTIHPFASETNIFITPSYQFKVVDRLMTNFHLPKSTLFMLVSAFCGLERMQRAYAHAIAQAYRFYSYGDTSLLERCP
jgi:S-adenosylmethionine:tRNA ribosyltransferase-isomerase